MRLTRGGHDRSSHNSGHCADRSARACPRNASDNRSETRASGDFPSSLLTFAAGFRFGRTGHHLARCASLFGIHTLAMQSRGPRSKTFRTSSIGLARLDATSGRTENFKPPASRKNQAY
jgi:hypothetical protein